MSDYRSTVAAWVLTGMLAWAAPATAGDCWVPSVEGGDRIGVAANAVLRGKVLRAEQALRRDRAANAIRDVRYQVHRSIDWEPRHAGAPLPGQVHTFLHKPDSWAGKCGLQGYADDVHFATLNVFLNALDAVVSLTPSRFDDWDAFFAPAVTGRRQGFPIYGNRVLVITPSGIDPLAAVTVGEYLDYWERRLQADAGSLAGDATPDAEWLEYIRQLEKSDPQQAAELRQTLAEGAASMDQGRGEVKRQLQALRQRRASLSPAQRKAPVYVSSASVDGEPFGYAKAGEPGAQAVVRINPDLWRGTKNQQAVRSVALAVGLSRLDTFDNHDPDAQIDQIIAWLGGADLAPYRELLDR